MTTSLAPAVEDVSSRLAALLNTSLERINSKYLRVWHPGIDDVDLRAEMQTNPRLHDRILSDILQRIQSGIGDELEPFEEEPLLLTALQMDQQDLFQALGLAWNANLLSRMALCGTSRLELSDIPREEVRRALRYRALACQRMEDGSKALAEMRNDGLVCFLCWLHTLPSGVVARVKLCLPDCRSLPDKLRPEVQAALCRKVLADLCEQEAPE